MGKRMEKINPLTQYRELLLIRQRARKRDTVLIGGIFTLAVALTLGAGLLGMLAGRAVYLLVGFLIAFGAGFGLAAVRLAQVQGQLELLGYLEREFKSCT